MKPKTRLTIIGGGLFGLLAGYVVMSSQTARILTLAGVMSIPTAIGTAIFCDRNAQNQLKAKDDKLLAARKEASQLPLLRAKLASADETSQRLRRELAKIGESLKKEKTDRLLADNRWEKGMQEQDRLEESIYQLQKSLKETQDHLDSALEELEQWEQGFTQRLEKAISERVAEIRDGELDAIFEEHDRITQEAIAIAQGYQAVKDHYTQRFQEKTEFIRELVHRFNEPLSAKDEQIQGYLEQIEALNGKIALLQQELAGDLIEPEYGKFGYQCDAQIADDIVRKVWDYLKVPLCAKGYRALPDGSASAGYGYSRSMPVEALARDLQRLSGQIAKDLGIHEIKSVRKHELSNLLIVSWRCDRPKPISEDAFYRIVEPATICSHLIRDAMDHKKGGKPTLRIMGSTGSGKGLLAKALLADWVKSEPGEVWLSDPMDGSEEDRWEVPKVARSAREARQLLSKFNEEFTNRKNKSSTHKDIQVLGLFDELDAQHPKEDKDLIKNIWTAIRHYNMKLILMGQSAEVGCNGWKWDEMKNCACLFVGNSITTAIKHSKDLGLSKATANQLEAQNDQIINWLDAKNQGLDAANQYRVGLLICADKAKFVEFPPAYKGTIQSDKSFIVSHPWDSVKGESKPSLAESRVCPVCGSKLRKSGNRLRCDNPKHTKDMGKKSFSLSEQI